MDSNLLQTLATVTGIQFYKDPDLLNSSSNHPQIMDDDDVSVLDSPSEITEESAYDKQRATLQTYLNSLPYKCESIEEMDARLEEIVAKIFICAASKNWLVLSTWDGLLQWFVRYNLFLHPLLKEF